MIFKDNKSFIAEFVVSVVVHNILATLCAAASYLGPVSIPPTGQQYPHPMLLYSRDRTTYCRVAKRYIKGSS